MKQSFKVKTMKTSKLLRKTVWKAWRKDFKQQSNRKSQANVETHRPRMESIWEMRPCNRGRRSQGSGFHFCSSSTAAPCTTQNLRKNHFFGKSSVDLIHIPKLTLADGTQGLLSKTSSGQFLKKNWTGYGPPGGHPALLVRESSKGVLKKHRSAGTPSLLNSALSLACPQLSQGPCPHTMISGRTWQPAKVPCLGRH